MEVINGIEQIFLITFGMIWQVLWSLTLGFVISGMVQAYVSKDKMGKILGKAGLKEIALATSLGAASSSCSYASIAVAKSMFKKGANLIPALAFMFASTNLVIELGIILWQLMGWQFTLAEWFGGLILITLMTFLIKLTYPKNIIEEGRAHKEPLLMDMDHGSMLAPGKNLFEKLISKEGWVLVSQNVLMDYSMLWKDLFLGFIIAGTLAVVMPNWLWNLLFIQHAPTFIRIVENAFIGPIVGIISFVCSIGNVPLAAILFAGGISFGGAIAFLYSDLIVFPIIDIYRKYYGWKMALYITGIMFLTMSLTAIIVDLVFRELDMLFPSIHFIPNTNPHFIQMVTNFSWNYTTFLNFIALIGIFILFYINKKHPMMHH